MDKEQILDTYESFKYTGDGCDELHYYRDNVLMAMEEYHQAKLKLLPSLEAAYKEGLSRKRRGEKQQHWKAKIFAAGANWMKSVAIGCSDVVGRKDYVSNVR